jgi:putative transposase
MIGRVATDEFSPAFQGRGKQLRRSFRRVATIDEKETPMANTYTSLHYHFTFSTKNREPWIAAEIENRVWAYIGGIARQHKMTALQVGGIEDHVHALLTAPPTFSPSEIAQYLKGESSKWIHQEFPKAAWF